MIGFGAIVKSIAGALEVACSAAIFGIRLALAARRPKLCPIPVSTGRRRR